MTNERFDKMIFKKDDLFKYGRKIYKLKAVDFLNRDLGLTPKNSETLGLTWINCNHLEPYYKK